ncbi:MAG TPA: APC family permease [Rhizomicrobium sp.]|nr:APC family permease [Rhizomicrobium sp.]
MAARASHGNLLRILGVAFGVAVALGNTIGAGILRSPAAIAVSVQSGQIILLLWFAGALHAALDANLFVEMGTALPKVGGPYVYARRALGDVAGLVVGWSIWCSKLAGIAAGAVSFANFFAILVPAAEPRQAGIAIAVQLVLYGANVLGLREGRALQQATSFLKAGALLLFAIVAVFAVPAQAAAVLPSPQTAITWTGIALAYQLIRGAYSGWDAPVYFLEESHAPARTLPRALFAGLLVSSALYLIVNAALLYSLGVRGVAASALPFMTVLQGAAGSFASALFAIGAMITVLSMANANIMSSPRILLALSRDRLLPQQLGFVNAGGSPQLALLMTAIGSLALAATGSFIFVFGLIGTLDTVSGVLVIIAFFALRRREPRLERPFRALGYPVLPAVALAIEIFLLVLFNAADKRGFLAVIGLSALCVPLAWIARRSRMDDPVSSETS